MNQKRFAYTILIVATVIAIGIVGYFTFIKKLWLVVQQPTIDLAPNSQTQTLLPTNQTADWETYRNNQYGFQFQYPISSTIVSAQDLNYQYIRLQNFDSSDVRTGLSAGEYYLEIFIFDNNLGHQFSESCRQSVVDPKKVELGTVTGYRGYGEKGGDAGGRRFALCVERSKVHFYIQGTENDEKALFVNSIFDTLKFVD